MLQLQITLELSNTKLLTLSNVILDTTQPANLMSPAKHPAFSTNHLADNNKIKYKVRPRTR